VVPKNTTNRESRRREFYMASAPIRSGRIGPFT
jgi:hypothetical protein